MDAISTAMTGLRTWGSALDVAADNIANADDVAPVSGQVHRTATLQTGSLAAAANGVGQGVGVTGVTYGPNGMLVQQPDSPMADAQGYVRAADVDMVQQVGGLIGATFAVELNAVTIDRALDAYRSILGIGTGS